MTRTFSASPMRLARQVHEVIVVGEENHLHVRRQLRQELQRRRGAHVVEVHEDVVEDER